MEERSFPIVQCPLTPSTHEQILLTKLRKQETQTKEFRDIVSKLGSHLVSKVVNCLPTQEIKIQTPVTQCLGLALEKKIELVSVMRSGDALLESFVLHFPDAHISKFLIQRDEETAEPHFKYMKISPTIASDCPVIIVEPMIATGGTLGMVINLLKEKGVSEHNIIIASVCVAPEGLERLSANFPQIKMILNVLDEKLNDRKFIVPGLGDFGDRYFGTTEKPAW